MIVPQYICAIAVATCLITGCKGYCRQLSEKLCDCFANSSDKSSCLQRAASNEASIKLSQEDEATCERLYEGCDCRLIDTPSGKVRCGLARELPQ